MRAYMEEFARSRHLDPLQLSTWKDHAKSFSQSKVSPALSTSIFFLFLFYPDFLIKIIDWESDNSQIQARVSTGSANIIS